MSGGPRVNRIDGKSYCSSGLQYARPVPGNFPMIYYIKSINYAIFVKSKRKDMCESVTLDMRIRAYLSITRSGIDRDHAVVEVVLETNLWQEDFHIFSGNKAI